MRWLAISLSVAVLAATGSALAAPPPGGSTTAATARSSLVRKYPLAARKSCCVQSKRALHTRRAAQVVVAADPAGPPAIAIVAPLLAVVLACAVAMQRFTWQEGQLLRRRPRRRWTVGRRAHRLAVALGFRHSRSRDALVLHVLGGRFGPVLQRRRAERIAAWRDGRTFPLSRR